MGSVRATVVLSGGFVATATRRIAQCTVVLLALSGGDTRWSVEAQSEYLGRKTRWYLDAPHEGKGSSCDDVCSSEKNRAGVGASMSCNAERLSNITRDNVDGVLSSIYEADRARSSEDAIPSQCSDFGDTTTAPAYVEANGKCVVSLPTQGHSCQISLSAPGKRMNRRICCCPIEGEDAQVVCAVASSDCTPPHSFWYPSIKACGLAAVATGGCESGAYLDGTECRRCQIGKWAPAGTVGACKVDCPAGRYGASLVFVGMDACQLCPAWGTDTPAGQKHCIGEPSVGWILSASGESCDDACGHASFNGTCVQERLGAINSEETFKTAVTAVRAAHHVSVLRGTDHAGVNGYDSTRNASYAPFVSSNGRCLWNKPENKPDSNAMCGSNEIGIRRLCCCAKSDKIVMCPTVASDCQFSSGLGSGREWNGAFCERCTPGKAAGVQAGACRDCLPGFFAAESGLSECSECPSGRYGNIPGGRALEASCLLCESGTSSSTTGLGTACPNCPAGAFADTPGRTACSMCSTSHYAAGAALRTACTQCPGGRFGAVTGGTAASDCELYVGAMCPTLVTAGNLGANLGGNVRVQSRSSILDGSSPAETATPHFGDQASLVCLDGTPPEFGPEHVSCGLDGTWQPDPTITTGATPTQCTAKFCPAMFLPGAGFASVLKASSKGAVRVGDKIYDLVAKQAPIEVSFVCDPSASMIIDSAVYELGYALSVECTVNDLFWKNASGALVDMPAVNCLCGQGFKQGAGEKVSECVACPDATYAPLDVHNRRTECRACPNDGVNCNDGVLVILKNYWYNTKVASTPDAQGKLGLTSESRMYLCTQRNACLLDTSVVPMTVRCHENHTGPLCSRCYARRVDCGRGTTGDQPSGCASPGYFDRGEEWMYFASIARHCVRCPSGSDAVSVYVYTAAIAATFAFTLVAIVVHRLMSAWQRLMGKRRSDASGIARVFFNWAQMVSMLQSVKLQPPEEVTNAMETAEVLNVSVEWWPVQCTLRLTFLTRVLIYMAMPVFAVLVPLAYVYVLNKCDPVIRMALARHRSVLRTGKKLKGWAKLAFAVVSALSGEDMVKKATKTRAMRVANRFADEVEDLHDEIDILLDEIESAELELAVLKRVRTAEAVAIRTGGGVAAKTARGDSVRSGTREPSITPPRPPSPARSEGGSETEAQPLADLADPQLGDHVLTLGGEVFFKVTSTMPIALRAVPSRDGAKLGAVVRHNDVLRSELMKVTSSCRFIKLAGPWGEGWLFDRLADGTVLLSEVDAGTVINVKDPVEAYHREEIVHLFRTLGAISDAQSTVGAAAASDGEPSISLDTVSIAKEAIEYLLPSKMTEAETGAFFAGYDDDGDGTIDFGEFVAMYPVLRETWRFERVWEEFQHMDESRDGRLEESELYLLVPQGSSRMELNDWMMRYDSGGKGYLTMADFVAIHKAVGRDRLMLAIGTSFVLCTYFVYSRVTKALLSVFSVEKVEGILYLKMEMGTPANTPEHIFMMGASGLYMLGFTVAVPLIGLYIMFQVRHKQDDRRVGTMAGFLMDGYRPSVAWFWEFIVLGRKLAVLSVSLFVAEPFMQSFVAIIILIASLSIQLLVQPFELKALNLLEVFALSGLLATQLSGTLMWYKNQPGRNEHIDVYRVCVVTSCTAVERTRCEACRYYARDRVRSCSPPPFFAPSPHSRMCTAHLTRIGVQRRDDCSLCGERLRDHKLLRGDAVVLHEAEEQTYRAVDAVRAAAHPVCDAC